MKKTLLLILMAVMTVCAFAQSPLRQKATPQLMMQRHAQNPAVAALKAPSKVNIDYDIIYDDPEGERKRYSRSGYCYVEELDGSRHREEQKGQTIDIVFDYDNGFAYLYEPVSGEGGMTWVKASIEGDKLRLPMFQCLYYDDYYEYGYMICRIAVSNGQAMVDLSTTEMTYTMHDDGSISLDGTDGCSAMLGLVYTDDFSWSGFGDYESVYTPFGDAPTFIPDGLSTEEWMYSYVTNGVANNRIVDVATDYADNKIYIAGIHPVMNDHAIVGIIGDDDVVTFAADQFLGEYMGYNLYVGMCSSHPNNKPAVLTQAQMKLNREARILEPIDDFSFFQNAGKTAEVLYFWSFMDQPRFVYFNNDPATPADPAITGFTDSYSEYGYNSINFDIKLQSVDGDILSPDLVKYIVWVKVEGEPEPFVFYPDEYYSLSIDGIDELTEVPYGFYCYARQGYTEIYPGGKIIYIYQIGFDDYGIQTIYYGGGERMTSNIVWLGHGIDGVDTVLAPAADSAQTYDFLGRRISAQQSGLRIVKAADGSSRKVLR